MSKQIQKLCDKEPDIGEIIFIGTVFLMILTELNHDHKYLLSKNKTTYMEKKYPSSVNHGQ